METVNPATDASPERESFGILATVESGQAVLGLWGEFDLVTAPTLSVFVDAVLELGQRHVVLDLAQLEFIDAAALRPVVDALSRLKAVGGDLTLRSPSPMTAKILEITGLAALLGLDPSASGGETAAPGSRGLATRAPARDRTPREAVPRHAMVDALLDLVVVSAHAAMPDAHGVSVSLERREGFVTAASSDELVAAMDTDQYDTNEGPCLTAAREGRTVHVASVADEVRWPAFIVRAHARGINTIHSTPLRAGMGLRGALNVYSRTAGTLTQQAQDLAALFAGQASTVLSYAGHDAAGGPAPRSGDALRARTLIAQAQGVLMEREHVGAGEAFTALRRAARQADTTLVREAAQTVASAQPDRPPTPEHDR